MKFFSKKYMLFIIAFSLAYMPVEPLVPHANAKKYKVTIEKISHNKDKVSKARQLTVQEQRARDLGEFYDGSSKPDLSSSKALIVNQTTGEIKYAKNSSAVAPIASITKLMTAMVVLDAKQSFDETIRITNQEVDTIKNTWSSLKVGTTLRRSKVFQLALMASENRAAYALASNYPGGKKAFVKAMNKKAVALGLTHTNFSGPTGLMYQNTSTAEDLYKLVAAAYQYPEIRKATTRQDFQVHLKGNENPTKYKNTNKLVRKDEWDIGLSKTGFIDEAGRCLVMQATVDGEPIIAVFLDAEDSNKRTGDVIRIRKWIEYNHRHDSKVVVAKQQQGLQPKLVMSERIWN